jgi:phycobilisome core linker protein
LIDSQTLVYQHPKTLLEVRRILAMRMFKVTACVPSQTRIRTQRELQNTYFTKLVPYDNWFREQQRIMKMGGKIVKVELATGKPGANTGLL